MLPIMRVVCVALLIAACIVCSTLCAAPAGWTCGPDGCRPAAGVTASQRMRLRDRRGHRGPISRILSAPFRLAARALGRGC